MNIEIGQRFDAAFGRYRVLRIDGETIWMADLSSPSAAVMASKADVARGDFWPVVDVKPANNSGMSTPPELTPAAPGPARKARAKAPKPAADAEPAEGAAPAVKAPEGSIARAAYLAWQQTLRPRPTEAEACPFMAKMGRIRCGFAACIPACPRHEEHVAPAPAARNPDPPPLEAAELAAIWARVPRVVPDELPAPAAPAASPPTAADPLTRPPEPELARPLEPAADPPSAPAPAADAVADAHQIPRAKAYPPCLVCGQIRTIMLVLAPRPGKGADDYATLCSPCAQGGRPSEEEERESNRQRFIRFFGREP